VRLMIQEGELAHFKLGKKLIRIRREEVIRHEQSMPSEVPSAALQNTGTVESERKDPKVRKTPAARLDSPRRPRDL
jgi:hypothetical protein